MLAGAIGIPKQHEGRYMRLVERLVIHGEPLGFRQLCARVLTSETRYLVFDLDRTFHLGINMGEALGFELMACRCYGQRYEQLIESGQSLGPFVMDWRRPAVTLEYLRQGTRRWAWPGLVYLTCVKLGTRTARTRGWLHRHFGARPVEAVQHIPRTTLLHALSELPAETLRTLARRVWRRHDPDQVILRQDIAWVRAVFPSIRVLISSASPQPVLEAAAEEIGADDIFYTALERRDGYFSAPPERLAATMPRRIAPLSTLRHNAGMAKMEGLIERYPEFGGGAVETVGVTDTSYGEDHSWTGFFTKVVDINSPTPFAPIVQARSPLREIHSAQVLTRGELLRKDRGDRNFLDRRRSGLGARVDRSYEREELCVLLGSVLEHAEQLAAGCVRELSALHGALHRLQARTAELQEAMERTVSEYNDSSGQARRVALERLRSHLREEERLGRARIRKERPIAVFHDLLTRLLQESRAALESPAQAHQSIGAIVERYARRIQVRALASQSP